MGATTERDVVARPPRWIEDNRFEPRYQFWTRANVSEVLPEPPTPLGWDLVWERASVAGWRDLFINRLGMEDDELDPVRSEQVGIFGGYAYLGASLFRVWAGRTPGMTPTTIDDVYFGDHPDVPPYVPEPWHANPHTTEVMTQWLQWATVDRSQHELEADRAESLDVRARRPELGTVSDERLLGHMLSLRPLFRRMFHQHINQSIAASVGPGILGQICTAIGQPQWAMRMLAGLGDVDSAAPSYAMWELSRVPRDTPEFEARFDAFLAEFGSRGPNEWDLVADVWELAPATALAAIDRLRSAPDSASPLDEHAARERERHELADEVRAALADDDATLAAFETGLVTASTFIPGRERSKTTVIRVIHEARVAAVELGRRLAARGVLDSPTDVFMLFVDELTEAVAGNTAGLRDTVAPRRRYREWLSTLEPPFIFNGHAPDVTTWAKRGERAVTPIAAGDTITGVPGCPGLARGRAQVVLDPRDPIDLEPGDVLVAPATDPSWTPLFVAAAAVVVDVGAALSHAVIVSRELGIPCVPSAVDATRRIPSGALVEVDGDAGTVTVLELPT